mgnify:CR=1 FL=1
METANGTQNTRPITIPLGTTRTKNPRPLAGKFRQQVALGGIDAAERRRLVGREPLIAWQVLRIEPDDDADPAQRGDAAQRQKAEDTCQKSNHAAPATLRPGE